VPNVVLTEPGVAPHVRVLYAILIAHRNRKTGACHPGVERLVDLLGYKRTAVHNAIKALEGLGWLKVERARPAVNRYHNARGIEAPADWRSLESPETYLGYERAETFASPGTAPPSVGSTAATTMIALTRVPACVTTPPRSRSGQAEVGVRGTGLYG
jgi:hypothetical protein